MKQSIAETKADIMSLYRDHKRSSSITFRAPSNQEMMKKSSDGFKGLKTPMERRILQLQMRQDLPDNQQERFDLQYQMLKEYQENQNIIAALD